MWRINVFLSSLVVFFVTASACKQDKTSLSKEYQPTRKPNIVFVLADDLGIGDLGCYGQELIKTPNLNRMAKGGMLFTGFYSGSTVCAPSRASLMTGKHTGGIKIRGNGEFPLDTGDTTMAQILKSKGYQTAMFGKWGLGLKGTAGSPEKKGWDHFTGHLHHIEGHYQKPDSLWSIQNGRVQKNALGSDEYANEIFTQKGIEFIDNQNSEQPFFLYMSYTIPHAELKVKDEFMELYLDDEGKSIFEPELEWPQGRHYGAQAYPKAAYAAMVSALDDYLGRLLKKLEAKGLEKNTLVIFSSDNGTHIEGGRTMEDVAFFNSTAGLRGVKRDLYEGGIRSPLIAYWPQTISKGSTSSVLAAYWDLLPTFAELAGYQKSLDTDGISLVDVLLEEKPTTDREFLYWEFHGAGGKIAIRMEDWKVVWTHLNDPEKERTTELYNLKNDPLETVNLVSKYPEIIQKAREIFNQEHQEAEIEKFKVSLPKG